MVDTNGAVVAEYEYSPFGQCIKATGPMAAANPWRFSTRYYDTETGLLMYPRRPYSPTLGRFLCKDPIGETGGANLYVTCGNNMVNSIDPWGLKICAPAKGCLKDLMEMMAAKYNIFTKKGTPDPKNRLTWKVLSCIAGIESGFDPCAKGTTGDYGLMQLTKDGGIAECQRLGIFPKEVDYSEEHRKKCCPWSSQPRICKNEKGEYERERVCAEGCENSIWNVEKQIECAAALLKGARDAIAGDTTLEQMLCVYNRGTRDPRCKNPEKAKDVPYVKEVMECLGNIDKIPPTPGPDVVVPPEASW